MKSINFLRTFNALVVVALSLVASTSAFAQWSWVDSLPYQARQSIIWSADNEEGNLVDWDFSDFEFPGGGVFKSDKEGETFAEPSVAVSHSGLFSIRTTIRNAFRSENGKRAVRLSRWTNGPWDEGGFYFPKTAYYSTWVYFPENYNPNKSKPWDPGDGGWWTVFQFETLDDAGVAQPMWSLNVDFNKVTKRMEFYLHSPVNSPATYAQAVPAPIPVGRWVHIEALYRVSALDEGQVTIWQNGKKIIDANNVRTAATIFDENAIWSIGNQTDHIAGGPKEGEATIYFDDSIVSRKRISSFLLRVKKKAPR